MSFSESPSAAVVTGHPGAALLRRWGPLAVALGVLAYHVAPIWADVSTWAGWWDCRYFWFIVEVDRVSIGEHGQFPLWNPFYCGGAPHFANPQAGSLSPLTPLILLFGTPIGYRLGYTAGLLTALLSMRAYARTLSLSEVASSVAGGGFAISGALTMHMAGGHWAWMGFALYPLMLRSLYLAVEGRRAHIVWGALVIAIIIYHSPIYPLAFSFVTLGVYGLFLGLRDGPRDRRRLVRALVSTAAILAMGMVLGAMRVLPMAEFIAAHPRSVKDWDYTWPHELVTTYALRHRERAFGDHQYVFPEFGNYFGLIGVALMLAGMFVVLRRRRALWPLVAAAFVFVLFQLGNLIPMPWWLLKHLPVYKNLRVAARFTIVVGIFFCALIGVAVDEWGARALARWRALNLRRRLVGVGVLALAVGYMVDAASWNRLQFLPTFGSAEPREPRAPEFRQVPGDRGNMMAYPRANEGTLSCFEETPLDISPRLRGNLPADEYLSERDAGTVRRLRWSPNRIVLDVDVKRATTVLVNQNMGVGWQAEGGEIVAGGVDGLLAARVAPGRHTLTLSYLPRTVILGGAISLMAFAAAATVLVLDHRQARRRRKA
jgi:hypothetical protein